MAEGAEVEYKGADGEGEYEDAEEDDGHVGTEVADAGVGAPFGGGGGGGGGGRGSMGGGGLIVEGWHGVHFLVLESGSLVCEFRE